jgi:putative toxin-antitoxin system antitoxin component (TIGR02293 family)
MEAFRPPTARPEGVLHDLGLTPSPTDLIAAVKAGLHPRVFVDLARRLEVSEAQLGEVVGLAPTTLSRRKRSGSLTAAESEHVLRVAALLQRATDVFEAEPDAAAWLRSPNPALAGATPLATADTEIGAREVEDLLGRLEHGVYS